MDTENYLYTNLETYQNDIEEMNDVLENTLNTIKELKEENERLKIQLNNADNKNLELIEELNKEIDRYEDTISFELGYDKGSKEYKSRCEKAIEYIKENEKEYGSLEDNERIILNILTGDDK